MNILPSLAAVSYLPYFVQKDSGRVKKVCHIHLYYQQCSIFVSFDIAINSDRMSMRDAIDYNLGCAGVKLQIH